MHFCRQAWDGERVRPFHLEARFRLSCTANAPLLPATLSYDVKGHRCRLHDAGCHIQGFPPLRQAVCSRCMNEEYS